MKRSFADLGWAACALDGEGCIRCSTGIRPNGRQYWSISVTVSNTDPRFPRKMLDLFGGSISRAKRSRRERERPTYEWRIASRKAEAMLRVVLPYLVIKREQAEIALAIADTMSRKGRIAWTGNNVHGRRSLRPEVVVLRETLNAQLKVLKRNPPKEEAIG